RHAVVLDLPVTQRSFAVRMIGYERLEHPCPMRRDTRRTLLMHEGEKLVAVLRIGAREHRAIAAEPLYLRHRMQRVPLCIPTRRIAAPEAIEQFLRFGKREVVRLHFDVEQHDVHVVEEVKVDMHDLERVEWSIGTRLHAYRCNILAPEYPHRRLGARVAHAAPGSPLSIQKLLHEGQEGDELVIVALVETRHV